MSFLVLDIETGGLTPGTNPILSIGAVDYASGDEFYIECGAQPNQQVDDAALKVNGFTSERAFDPSKVSQADAYRQFALWAKGRAPLIAGQQVGSFDIPFLKHVAKASGQEWPFGHRSIDIHSISFARYGESLSLDGILKACGLTAEPRPHHALTGARLERDVLKVLLGGAPCGCRADGWKS